MTLAGGTGLYVWSRSHRLTNTRSILADQRPALGRRCRSRARSRHRRARGAADTATPQQTQNAARRVSVTLAKCVCPRRTGSPLAEAFWSRDHNGSTPRIRSWLCHRRQLRSTGRRPAGASCTGMAARSAHARLTGTAPPHGYWDPRLRPSGKSDESTRSASSEHGPGRSEWRARHHMSFAVRRPEQALVSPRLARRALILSRAGKRA